LRVNADTNCVEFAEAYCVAMVNSAGRNGLQLADVVAAEDRSYLEGAMPAIESTVRLSRPLLLLAVFGGISAAATLALWAYYGTAVFLEIVRTGWAACF
jgi:hypothetical protein